MKQVTLASLIVIAAMTIGLLAIAVAQKDARSRSVVATDPPSYSQQSPVPITWPPASIENESRETASWPPPPTERTIFRANDSQASRSTNEPVRSPFASPYRSLVVADNSDTSDSESIPSSDRTSSDEDEETDSEMPFVPMQEIPSPFVRSSIEAPSTPTASVTSSQEEVVAAAFQDGSSPTMANPFPTQPQAISPPPRIGSNLGGYDSTTTTPSRSLSDPPSFGGAASISTGANNGPGAYPQPTVNGGSRFSDTPSSGEDRIKAVISNSADAFRPAPTNDSNYPIREVPPNLDPAQNGFGPSNQTGSSASIQSGFGNSNRGVENATMVRDTPGNRTLDGVQNPNLQILKKAPEEVQVGMPAVFSIIVRNVGNFDVHDVRVYDRVPRGTLLRRTNPQAQQNYDGSLMWSLGSMPVGAEQTISIELMPEIEGEIGSVASATFQALASVRTVSTSPRLEISQFADPTVLLGDQWLVRIQVTNQGTGTARNVTIEEDVPAGLRHPLGPALGLDPFDLAPGQSRAIDLELLAVEPSKIRNQVRVKASNAQPVQSTVDLHVVAPKLQLSVNGPRLRYLERQATYQIEVTNHGTAIARNVDLLAFLPRGMQFNSAANQGEYLSDRHAVAWSLEELAPGATASTELAVMPIEEGDFVLRLQCRAEGIQSDPLEKQVRIEGRSELTFSIEDSSDPIEVDGQTTYTVRVSNVGTRVDQNVQVSLELPASARILNIRSPVSNQQSGSRVIFDPIPEMRAKDQLVYQVTVQFSGEGTQVAKAYVKSQLRPTPVAKEESTQVYLDR